MNLRKMSISLALLALVAIGIASFMTSTANAQVCLRAGGCTGVGCVKIPTSLAVASGPQATAGEIGWEPGPTSCGTKSCLIFLRCPCGPKLATTTCTGSNFPPNCI